MICPGCEGKNRDDARFCKFCGADLFATCRMCGGVLDEDARFCDACGTAVGSDAGPAAAARKVVTVLFADLTGSTALEENMDAEAVRSILDRFYGAMRAEVERHGGRVVKFTGDGVMAAFGVPEVQEDDAARAVDAALAMRDELQELASDLGLDLSLKIGINTGEVVVSESDEDVVGDAVNVASRLEGAASAGEILAGEDTWRLTRATSRYEPVKSLELKGKSEPVPAYKLLSVDERTADSAAAPFVGRGVELGKLLSVFQQAVESNSARLVTIIGSPGLGKTRLARELMAELGDSARVRETRCDPAGTATFAPIADALREASGLSETDDEEQVIATLAARLPEDDPDRDRIAARAAAILGVGQPGSTEETFWAIRRLIEAAAHDQPVVFVLDDVHWAEPLMFDLIEHLAEWIRDAPVLLVGTARPELRDIRPSLAEGGRSDLVISLEGLDQRATAQLALNLLGADELPAELLTKIPASTEGNPLFVRELVRMLVDDGVLQRTADGWNVTIDVEAIQVPPTIQSLLSARVDRLRNDERTVVELASVVGKEFYRGALYDLAPAGVKDLVDGCLESLRRKELVEPVGTYWIDEPVYRFHHVLIRDAAYRRLLKESRADLHERVAEWLERKTSDVLGEHDELVGYHLEQAHDYKQQLGRMDEPLGRRAAELLGTAARRALDYDDLPAAAALSGRALDRLPEGDPNRSELLLVRCEALLSMGDVSQGAQAVADFEALVSTPRLAAWATCFSGQLSNLRTPERLQEIEALVSAAASELAGLGDSAGAAKAHTVHASTLAGLGRFAECETVLDLALNAARAAEDRRLITATLGAAPHPALWGPNPVSRAGGRCLDIIRLLRITTGSMAVETTSLRCQAVLEAFRGRAEAARRMLNSAKRTLTELGLELDLMETEQFLGIAELVAGDAAAAQPHLRVSHDGFLKSGVDVMAAQSAALLARAHLSLGEYDAAELLALESENLGGQDLKASIAWRAVKAELLARRGELDEARFLAKAAVELASRTDALIDHGNACRSLAVVLRTAGDADGARRAEESALALFERKGATALLESAEREPEMTTLPTPESSVASSVANSCTRVLERIRESFEHKDWSTFADLFAEGFVGFDRRPGLQSEVNEPDGAVEYMRGIAEVGGEFMTVDPLVVRGESLAIALFTIRGRHADFEVQVSCLYEIDRSARVVRWDVFDPTDEDAALDEADQRFAAGEGAASAEAIRLGSRFTRANNARDWTMLRDTLSDDLVLVDLRPASLGEMRGADEYVSTIKALVDLTSAYRSTIVAFHRLVEGVSVVELRNTGTTLDGGSFENAGLAVGVMSDGRLARLELYPLDESAAAYARFEELEVAASSTIGLPENRCVRVMREYSNAFNRRDLGAARALLSEAAISEDRRAGLKAVFEGREAFIGNLKAVAELPGTVQGTQKVLATRGERLALVSTHWSTTDNPASFHVEFLVLGELDEDGRFDRALLFDASDLDAALAELEDRFMAGEGAAFVPTLEYGTRFFEALNKMDLQVIRELMTDDCAFVDHRPASFGELSGHDYIDSLAAMSDLIATMRYTSRRFVRLTEDAALIEVLAEGATTDGSPIRQVFFGFSMFRDGQATRIEMFDESDIDAAVARFEKLLRPAVIDNRAFRVVERMAATTDPYERSSWIREDAVTEDHRKGLRSVLRGRDKILENHRLVAELRTAERESEPIATRGDRLLLSRRTYRSRGNEVEFLVVEEIDNDGRLAFAATFDPYDLDAAISAVDDRYLRGDDVPVVARIGLQFIRAYNEHDWDRVASLTDGMTFVDHQPVGSGVVEGADRYVEGASAMVELIPNQHLTWLGTLASTERCGVALCLVEGTATHGGHVENHFLSIVQSDAVKLTRIENFPDERVADALARFDELADTRIEPLQNLASRTTARINDCVVRRDWETLSTLLTEGSVFDDKRAGVSATLVGVGAQLANFRAVAGVGVGGIETSVLATRGDRLALTRILFVIGEGAELLEAEVLFVMEVDAEGRMTGASALDPDDFDAAFEELDERYLAGTEATDAERLGLRLPAIYNARDWNLARTFVAGDMVYVDHNLVSAGEIVGREAYFAHVGRLQELVPDIRLRCTAVLAASDRCSLSRAHSVGTDEHGGRIEREHVAVSLSDEGRLVRIETFPPERLAEATSRYEELASGSAPEASDPKRGRLENAASRVMGRDREFEIRGDWESLSGDIADDAVVEDRRPGFAWTIEGKDQVIDHLQVATAGVQMEAKVLAVRGERLALERQLITTNDFEVELLTLCETDDRDRIRFTAIFGPYDFDAAFEELDARYAAGEGAPFSELVARMAGMAKTWNARDWERYAAGLAEDVVFVDRRRASLGEIRGRDQLVAVAKDLLTPDIRHDVVAVRGIDQHCLAAEIVARGTNAEGGTIEVAYINVFEIRDGLAQHIERFATDDLEAALVRFEELRRGTPDASRRLENDATRAVARVADTFARRDWEALADVFAEDLVRDDRRQGIGGIADKDALVEAWKVMAELGYEGVRSEPVATRGVRLALLRVVAFGSHEFETALLTVVETDAEGRAVRIVYFDADHLDAAFDALDERFLNGEGASCDEVLRHGDAQREALASGDKDAYRRMFADDVVLIDHRPASLGDLRGVDEILGVTAHLPSLVTDAKIRAVAVHAIEADRSLIEASMTGTAEHGGAIEITHLRIQQWRDGRVARIELFPIDRLPAARARFDELGRASSGKPLANAADRHEVAGTQAMLAQRWDELASYIAEDAVLEDRRKGFGLSIRGREPYLENAKAARSIGVSRCLDTLIAVRGERLALRRRIFSGEPDSFESEFLGLTELDQEGLITTSVAFDLEDLDAAFAELEERYLVGEGAAFADTWRAARALIDTYNSRDWYAFRLQLADDAVLTDHRPASLGVLTPDQWLQSIHVQMDLAPDMHFVLPSIHYINRGIVLWEALAKGSTRDGGEVELAFFNLAKVRDGRIVRYEWFPLAALEVALARAQELDAESPATGELRLENDCTRNWDRQSRTFADRRWGEHEASVSERIVSEDRRAGLGMQLEGRESYMDLIKVVSDLGPVLDSEVVAVRGDRLALFRVQWRHPDPQADAFTVDVLHVHEVDGDGRLSLVIVFDLDDMEAAYAELDERFAVGISGALENFAVRTGRRFHDLFDQRDWDGFGLLLTDESVYEDRRKGMQFTVRGRDLRVENMKTIVDVGGTRISTSPLAIRGDLLSLHHMLLRDDDPENAFQVEILQLDEYVEDGRLAATLTFEPEDLDSALSELDERFAEAEGRGSAGTVRLAKRVIRALNTADWDLLRSTLSDDFVLVDHRSISLGEVHGPEAWIEALIALRELVTRASNRLVRYHALAPDRCVCEIFGHGRTQEGGSVETSFITLFHLRGDRIDRAEHFSVEQRDDALVRFEEFVPRGSGLDGAM
ncbi:MAG: nuclear transport factor 2 family protein [Actinomycetota bacterium]